MDKDSVAAAWRLPDAMWEQMEPLLPKLRKNRKGGRPWVPNRRIADDCASERAPTFGRINVVRFDPFWSMSST